MLQIPLPYVKNVSFVIKIEAGGKSYLCYDSYIYEIAER